MNFKDVLDIATQKGYIPYNPTYYFDTPETDYKIPVYLIELTLIQDWLREEHKIHVETYANGLVTYEAISYRMGNKSQAIKSKEHDRYPQALLEGINEALKLIDSPTLNVVLIYHKAKEIFESTKTWDEKYDLIFSDNISKKVYHLFDWYDPDTTYEEDVTAFMNHFERYINNK